MTPTLQFLPFSMSWIRAAEAERDAMAIQSCGVLKGVLHLGQRGDTDPWLKGPCTWRRSSGMLDPDVTCFLVEQLWWEEL